MVKSASFGVMHLGIAFTVAYALTGSVTIAGAITFVEPLVNTVAHFFFDRYWDHPAAVALRRRLGLQEDRRPSWAPAGGGRARGRRDARDPGAGGASAARA